MIALRCIGFRANRRLLEVEKITHDYILTEESFQQIDRPRQVASQRASALRFDDPQVQALWSALLVFTWLPTGFSNRNLREHFASLLWYAKIPSGSHLTEMLALGSSASPR